MQWLAKPPEATDASPLDRLEKLAERLGMDCELDEEVHAMFSRRASAANNGGLSQQIGALLGDYGEAELAERLHELADADSDTART